MTETVHKREAGEDMSADGEEQIQIVDPDDLPEGTPIGSDLIIERKLGTGGFATVYLARNRRVEHIRSAVKVLLSEYMTDEAATRRFLLEAEMGASLRSRHVVQVQSFGELANGTPYLVMEYIVGPDLEQLLAAKGGLTTLQTAKIARDILVAVDEAHSYGIVHRDLKPANVFLVYEYGNDEPISKVGDFGIGKQLGRGGSEQDKDHKLTLAGQILCTPAYAAPELLRGTANELTDIYALGHVFAELLEGEPPYVGSATTTDELHPMAIASNQIRSNPVPLSEETENSELGPIIRKALEKNPELRYQSASEMLADVWLAIEHIELDEDADQSAIDINFFFDEHGDPHPDTGQYVRSTRDSSKRRMSRTTGSRHAHSSNAQSLSSLNDFVDPAAQKRTKIAVAVASGVALLAAGALAVLIFSGPKESGSGTNNALQGWQDPIAAESNTPGATPAVEQTTEEAMDNRALPEELFESARESVMGANRAASEVRRQARDIGTAIAFKRAEIVEEEERLAAEALQQQQAAEAAARAEAAERAAPSTRPTERNDDVAERPSAPNSQRNQDPTPAPEEPVEDQPNPFGTGLR